MGHSIRIGAPKKLRDDMAIAAKLTFIPVWHSGFHYLSHGISLFKQKVDGAARVNAVPLRRYGILHSGKVAGTGPLLSYFLKGRPKCLSRAKPSSSVLAEVTKVMFMPMSFEMLSMLISGKMICSVMPRV